LKILFLTVIPTPYQRDLFQEIAATGAVDLQVLYYKAGAHDREWDSPDLLPFERILEGRTMTALGPSAHWNPKVMAEIDKFSADLVVISDYSALTAQMVMRRLGREGRPFIFWGEVPGFSRRGLLGSMVRRRLQAPLAKAEAIVGIGSVATDAYKKLFPHKPIFDIPYFCNLARFRAARDVAPIESDVINVLFSGQMIERKGVPILLAAFAQVARKHPKLRLMLLGNGPEKEAYQALVAEGLRERVIFLGHKDPKDLPSVFAEAHVFCLPSRHDGWGVVVNEALGAGLPIIVSDAVGSGPDLVKVGENGFITADGDVKALAKALDEISGNVAVRENMAKMSQVLSREWDVDEGGRRWVETATTILSQRRAK
jgi:glycosyltransferase involved in cell wall biosynthesis